MQIKELKIENFKGISYLKFSPKKINLIVGRNNTGKTSVLEAIDLLFNTVKLRCYFQGQGYYENIQSIIQLVFSHKVKNFGKNFQFYI